ncbi:hypothetical protein [Nonomuraea jabiensis]|uniref:hypothetical protein n=1 Tax=Nonomuraea jabiensis TaxID=882448 RepID=UPI003D73D38C
MNIGTQPPMQRTLSALRRMLTGPAIEFDEAAGSVTITYDYGYLTIHIDEHGLCQVSRTCDTPGEEHVPHGDGLTLDELRPLVYRMLCEAVEEAERRDASDTAWRPKALADPAVVYPPVETTEDWYRAAHAEGLAPMALRLAVERIAFTAGRPPCGLLVLHIPITSTAFMWVTGAENALDADLDDLRWHLWWYGPDEEESILGDTVSTEDAVELIAAELSEATATS